MILLTGVVKNSSLVYIYKVEIDVFVVDKNLNYLYFL